MPFAQLTQPSVFLATPGDVPDLRQLFVPMFDRMLRDAANDCDLQAYAWEDSISESGFDQWRAAQEQIPLPSDKFCKAVVCFFSERIGTPMQNPAIYKPYIGNAEANGCAEGHLVIDWKPGLEMEGGFALTGTVFEVLVALEANCSNGRPIEGSPPFRIWFIGDDTLLTDPPQQAHWGNGALWDRIVKNPDKGASRRLTDDYICQVTQLRNFMQYLRYQNIVVDERNVANDLDDSLEKCHEFLTTTLRLLPDRPDKSPFKGLQYYDTDDDRVFFGRDAWLKSEIARFRDTWAKGSLPFFGIYGGSGVGKSSLLRAGLLARLQGPTKLGLHHCLSVTTSDLMLLSSGDPDNPADGPLQRLLASILSSLNNKVAIRLPSHGCSVSEALDLVLRALDQFDKEHQNTPCRTRLVVGLDQFEELIDYRENKRHRERLEDLFQFITACCKTGRIGFAYTIQSNRMDLLNEVLALRELVNQGIARAVPPFGTEEIIDIAKQSFASVHIKLTRPVLDRLRQHVNEFLERSSQARNEGENQSESRASLLPLFSLTLQRLYEYCQALRVGRSKEWLKANGLDDSSHTAQAKISPDTLEKPTSSVAESLNGSKDTDLQLTLEQIPEELFRIEDAIAAQANRALADARELPGSDDDALSKLLRRVVRIESSDRIYLPATKKPSKGFMRALIGKLEDHRLLIPVRRDEVRLVHEAVVRSWDIAKKWFDQEKHLLRASRTLAPLAEEWRDEGELMLSRHKGDLAGILLFDWLDVFQPSDGTEPSQQDMLLRDFCLAYLAQQNTPERRVESATTSLNHFLLAAYYGRKYILRRYLAENPRSAKESKTKRGSSAITAAVWSRDVETVKMMIDAGADVTAKNDDEWQAIHTAAHLGKIDCFELLVEHGADARARGNGGSTPLHLAVVQGHFTMVGHLLDKYSGDPNDSRNDGSSPLMLACIFGEGELVERLLKHPAADPSKVDADGWSAFKLACRNADGNIIRPLLRDERTDPMATLNGYTPLHMAIAQGSPDTIAALLEDERIDRTSLIQLGQLLLDAAMQYGGLACVLALLMDPHGKVNVNESLGKGTALFAACAKEDLKLIRLLLKHGADVNRKDPGSLSPGLASAKAGRTKVLRVLVERMDPEDVDDQGRSALHLAALEGHSDCVALLLEFLGRRFIRVPDKSGNTPLHLAAMEGHTKVILLMQRGPAVRYGLVSPDPTDSTEFDVNAKTERGLTPLHFAAKRGDLRTMQILLDSGAAPELTDGSGQTPLLAAIAEGQEDAAEMLLLRGMNVDIQDGSGWTPLHFAVRRGLPKLYSRLLDSSRGLVLNRQTDDGQTPLHLAAKHGNIAAINALLKADAELEAIDKMGRTPFLTSIANGADSACQVLIENGANVEIRDVNDFTALHLAAEKGSAYVLEQILSKSSISVNARTKKRYTPLHLAAKQGDLSGIELLVNHGADLEASDDSGRTPLLLALAEGHANAAEFLMNSGAYLDVQDVNDWTPLHLSIEKGIESVLRELLERSNKDVNARTKDGQTPLHLAARKGNLPIIERLLSLGAAMESTDSSGFTPLLSAAANGASSAVDLLIGRGAKLEVRNINDWTALHFAIEKGLERTFLQALGKPEININGKTKEGVTPLHLAARRGDTKTCSILLQLEAVDVNAPDADGRTPLHYAVLGSRVPVFRLFLNSDRVNLAAKSTTGRNALHFAAQTDNQEICEILLKFTSLDLQLKTNGGKTACDLAVQAGHSKVVKLLGCKDTAKGAVV